MSGGPGGAGGGALAARVRRAFGLAAGGMGVLMGALAAGQEWRWSHPSPHGNNIVDLAHRAGMYVQVTELGGVYISTNRVIWERREVGTRRDLRGVAFLGERLLVTGESGGAWWSDDGRTFRAAVVEPATDDWFEGVAASATMAVAVGDNGAIYRSAEGERWNRVTGTGLDEWMNGVAYGAGHFVAVGESGLVASSPDGLVWTRRATGTTEDLMRVNFGGDRFLAVGRRGVVMVSTNGTTWGADGATGITNTLLAAAVGPGTRVAVGESAVMYRSPITGWQNHLQESATPIPAPDWTYLAALWDGQRYLAGGRTGVMVEGVQTNLPPFFSATLWFRLDESPRNGLWAVERLGDTYLAVGERGTVLSSISGTEWALESTPVDGDTILFGVGGSSRLALAVGSEGVVLRSPGWSQVVQVTNTVQVGDVTHALVSTHRADLLGVVWEAIEPKPTTNTLQGVGWDGTQYVVVGAQGTVLRSRDGEVWEVGRIPSEAFFSTVVPVADGWLAGGTEGRLFRSADGVAWEPEASGTGSWIYRLGAWGDTVVGVGQNGLILTRQGGGGWETRASGTDVWLTDVERVGGVYYVCGLGGTLLRSVDLAVWEPVGLPTRKGLHGLASSGAQLVMGGVEGIVLRGWEPAVPDPVAIRLFEHRRGPGAPVDLFLFEGTPERGFGLEGATAFPEWGLDGTFELGAGGQAVHGRPAAGAFRFYRTRTGP
ncbi:MAG: hypothetical protein KF833_08395 [Verrucomicrobiae bacterium]|nr:hypothetical protein [Verrucomicrobiae bacterium]